MQYLRGVAVLAVVVSHCASLTSGGLHIAPLLGGTLEHGRLGVDLFFQISGFIIAIVSLSGPRLAAAIGFGTFLLRRFIRIVPLMWIAVICFAALQWFGHVRGEGWNYVRAMLLLPGNLAPALIWTLRQELIFYLVFAFGFLSGGKARILPILWFAAILLVPRGPQTYWAHDAPLSLLLNLRNLGFGAGLLTALLWFRHTSKLRFRSPVEPLLVLAFAAALVIFGIMPMLPGESGIGPTLLLLPLLLFAAHVECPPGWPRRIGELFGNASYAIYLFHYPVISVLIALCRKLAPASEPWLVWLTCLVISTGAGIAAHFLLERPLLAAIRRYIARGRTASAALP
ncbi:acyltransferase [Sphingomonas sp. AR_OL41]|uniref:acyltransferase family protein n=1 Tax=Sphingomonas sp. AR_OL41 TaxID=3042729 RepID=UPI0024809389|nr:acyltransferase [Sphingomonas sp. AR_OL41]MDH7972650.1 acyltransferase [Sphingomonas sp. AR_OL41]